MPLDQAVLDFQALGPVETAEGPRTRVMVVAARRTMIERLLAAVRRAGLRPEGIDLSAFALIRALQEPSTGESSPGVLYVHVAGLTNLAVAEGGTCLFTRTMAGGFEAIITQLAERRALTLEHSRQWLDHVGLLAPLDEIEGDPEIVYEARVALDDGVRRIADEVRNSLDFYRMQEDTASVDHAVLTGMANGIAGFAEELSRELGLHVLSGAVKGSSEDALGGVEPGRLAVAAGLAVAERQQ
jgi:type IV pilus assembly protein PilM